MTDPNIEELHTILPTKFYVNFQIVNNYLKVLRNAQSYLVTKKIVQIWLNIKWLRITQQVSRINKRKKFNNVINLSGLY